MEIKEMIVITDGKSNIGGNPVTAAREAKSQNIIVNAIGIIDDHAEDDALEEVQKIAHAGSGMWEHTRIENLGYTMQMVTQKTVNKTIETVVGKELKEIVGKQMDEIEPTTRKKILKYMEQLEEDIDIVCCIVMDCSGSMKNKMATAKQSVIELMNSLNGRLGKNKVGVIAYPGKNGDLCRVVSTFTEDIEEVKEKIFSLAASGTTPTAAAINQGVKLILGERLSSIQNTTNRPLLEESMV